MVKDARCSIRRTISRRVSASTPTVTTQTFSTSAVVESISNEREKEIGFGLRTEVDWGQSAPLHRSLDVYPYAGGCARIIPSQEQDLLAHLRDNVESSAESG